MPQDDDLQQRMNAISVAELRRRVDLAIGYVRELRRSLAVHAGMTLENVPGAVPMLDPEAAERAYKEIIESLPLLRRRLTPEERKGLRRVSEEDRRIVTEVLDEAAAMEPEEVQAMVDALGLDMTPEQLTELREGMIKTDMLGEVQREVELLMTELREYQDRLTEEAQALARKLVGKGGPPS